MQRNRSTLEVLVIGITMIVLVIANFDAQARNVGVSGFLGRFSPSVLGTFNAWIGMSGGVLVYYGLRRKFLDGKAFGLLTLPLVTFIGLVLYYTWVSGGSFSGWWLQFGFYLLIVIAIATRPGKQTPT